MHKTIANAFSRSASIGIDLVQTSLGLRKFIEPPIARIPLSGILVAVVTTVLSIALFLLMLPFVAVASLSEGRFGWMHVVSEESTCFDIAIYWLGVIVAEANVIGLYFIIWVVLSAIF